MSHSYCKYERKLSCHSVSGSVCSPLPNCSVRLDCDLESLPGIVTRNDIYTDRIRSAKGSIVPYVESSKYNV